MNFTYSAIGRDGSPISGKINAESREDALNQLRNRGYKTLGLEQSSRLEQQISISTAPTKTDLAMMCTQWALMDGGNISQQDILARLKKTADNDQLKQALGQALEEVQHGVKVTDALGKHPHIFNEAFIAQLETAINTASIQTTMERLSTMYERNMRIEQEVRSALIQPGLTVLVAIGIVVLLMIMVIPQFIGIFESMNLELPIYTRILISMTRLLMSPWSLVLLAALIAAPLYLLQWQKKPENRAKLDEFTLRLPVVGKILQLSALSRIARTLATMLGNDMDLVDSIDLSSRAAGNAVLGRIMQQGKVNIEHGGKLFEVLERYPDEFPATITGMVESGEESGRLAGMIDRIADFYETRVEYEARNLAQKINPIMTIGLALIVGLIMLAVMAPMSSMIGELSK